MHRISHCRSASAEPCFQTESVQKLAESRRLNTERPTIFIDLRQPERQQFLERYKAVPEGQEAEVIWL